jgi:hypothetical protein
VLMSQGLHARLGMWTNVDNNRKTAKSHQIDYNACVDCTDELNVSIIDIARWYFNRG